MQKQTLDSFIFLSIQTKHSRDEITKTPGVNLINFTLSCNFEQKQKQFDINFEAAKLN